MGVSGDAERRRGRRMREGSKEGRVGGEEEEGERGRERRMDGNRIRVSRQRYGDRDIY